MMCFKHNLSFRAGKCPMCKKSEIKQTIKALSEESKTIAFEIKMLEKENQQIDKIILYQEPVCTWKSTP